MNTTIGIYNTHDLAVNAVASLKTAGYPVTQLSIMGLAQEEIVDEDMHLLPKSPIKTTGLGAGTILGTALGILTGVGIFAIPGLGFLYGAGALVGAIAGFDFGLLGGGIAIVLSSIGVKDENAEHYHNALVQGKYLVVAHGTEDEVKRAGELLHEHGMHLEIASH
jgi:hypothetical protein